MKNSKIALVIILCILSVYSINAQNVLQKNQYNNLEFNVESNLGYAFKETTSHGKATKTKKAATATMSKSGGDSNGLSTSLGFRAAFQRPINSLIYLFRGDYYNLWGSIDEVVLKREKVNNYFSKVPNFVTAAVLHPHNEKVYFFKKDKYYRLKLSDHSLEKTGTIGVDGWKGVPASPSAAVTVSEKNATYFFKGSNYYRFSYAKKRVDKSGVIGKDGWVGVPKSPDLAFKYKNGKYYFFKGEFYYRYNPKTKKVDKKELIKKGWKKLVIGMDAALFNATHEDVHFFNDDKARYFPLSSGTTLVGQSNRVETNGMLKKEMKTNTLGKQWYKGAPQNIDAATPLVISPIHSKHTKYLFFKGKNVYYWNVGNTKKLKAYDIKKQLSSRIPYDIDGAAAAEIDRTTSASLIYLFKYDKYYIIEFRAGNYMYKGSGQIKNKFPYAPDNIDAVRKGPNGFIFYKDFNYYTSSNVGSLPGKLLN